MATYFRANSLRSPRRNAKEQRHYNAVHNVQNIVPIGSGMKSKHQGSKPLNTLLNHLTYFCSHVNKK